MPGIEKPDCYGHNGLVGEREKRFIYAQFQLQTILSGTQHLQAASSIDTHSPF